MTITKLKKTAKELRKIIFEVYLKRGGHLSTSFSCIEILTALHFAKFIKLNKNNYFKKNRDVLIISKGHSDLSYYCLLYYLKIINKKTLFNLNKNIVLGGHLDHKVPGVELTTGSLGHGLGFAAGISLVEKNKNKKLKQYVLMGDAECAGTVGSNGSFRRRRTEDADCWTHCTTQSIVDDGLFESTS